MSEMHIAHPRKKGSPPRIGGKVKRAENPAKVPTTPSTMSSAPMGMARTAQVLSKTFIMRSLRYLQRLLNSLCFSSRSTLKTVSNLSNRSSSANRNSMYDSSIKFSYLAFAKPSPRGHDKRQAACESHSTPRRGRGKKWLA